MTSIVSHWKLSPSSNCGNEGEGEGEEEETMMTICVSFENDLEKLNQLLLPSYSELNRLVYLIFV